MWLLWKVLTSRWGLCVFNLILFYVSICILLDFVLHYGGVDEKEIREAEEIFEGVAVLFISYGVAVESRDHIMKLLHLYPRFAGPFEDAIDANCSDFGLVFLLLGLFIEIPVQLVKIPNRVANTSSIEYFVLVISALLVGLMAILLAIHTWKLMFLSPASVTAEKKNH